MTYLWGFPSGEAEGGGGPELIVRRRVEAEIVLHYIPLRQVEAFTSWSELQVRRDVLHPLWTVKGLLSNRHPNEGHVGAAFSLYDHVTTALFGSYNRV